MLVERRFLRMIEITDAEIKKAEEILLPKGCEFDEERINFIKDFQTCDLLAVPGSGKTTALVAKLYCIAQHLPLNDGRGILVLSHTNAAVEEIEKKLKRHCHNLFKYPNFVGTIQSFVNKFLANPACLEMAGSYIKVNDDESLLNESKKFYKSLSWKPDEFSRKKYLKNYLYVTASPSKSKLTSKEKNNAAVEFLSSLRFDFINEKIYKKGSKKVFCTNIRTNKSWSYYEKLKKWKLDLFNQGIVSFSESYDLTTWYLVFNNQVRKTLQYRFKYIFVDEAQDLDSNQLRIIDDVFYTSQLYPVIQRIGDVNQSIYSGILEKQGECVWQACLRESKSQKILNNSLRLTPQVAAIVDCLTHTNSINEGQDSFTFEVKGVHTLDKIIPPYLIIYDEKSKNSLIECFKNIIIDNDVHKAENAESYGFHIIGWVANKKDNPAKICLESEFEDYQCKKSDTRRKHRTLSESLQYIDNNESYKSVYNSLLTILCHVLWSVGYVKENGKYIYCNNLLREVQRLNGNSEKNDLKLRLYQWASWIVLKSDYEKVYNSIKEYLGDFINLFDKQMNSVVESFIEHSFSRLIIESNTEEYLEDIPIQIGTIHSVKGQTHCATMYIESEYRGSTELQRMELKGHDFNPLMKNNHNFNAKKGDSYNKQTLKMMYVGFSRPTHLLCFAVRKSSFSELDNVALYKHSGWKVIDIRKGY